MRILVTGASGQLGGELTALGPHSEHAITGVTSSECDIRDAAAVAATVARVRPQVVINCAAWTRVDDAESQREAAFAVNEDGAANLARACGGAGAMLCHISTDYVFGGVRDAPIDEGAPTFPEGVYAASKLAGERAVQSILPFRHAIVRTGWLYGRDGPNFVLTMLRIARERGRLRVVADQTGAPTWTGHLAQALLRLVEQEAQGVVHLTAAGETTWHGFATAIVEEAGMPGVPVDPIATEDYPVAATRPRYSVLDNRRWREMGQPPLPPWRDGLRAYLAAIGAVARERGRPAR